MRLGRCVVIVLVRTNRTYFSMCRVFAQRMHASARAITTPDNNGTRVHEILAPPPPPPSAPRATKSPNGSIAATATALPLGPRRATSRALQPLLTALGAPCSRYSPLQICGLRQRAPAVQPRPWSALLSA
jgi:hypothetical protein